MKKILLFVLLIFSCATKNQNIIIIEKDDSNEMLEVYYRLIDGIKYRNYEKISSCYTKDSYYSYDQNTGNKYICFNNEKKVNGNNNILLQYQYLFKKNILDKIEYEIITVDSKSSIPKIKFLNAWQNSDDDVIEIIEFVKVQNKYYISGHTVIKKQ